MIAVAICAVVVLTLVETVPILNKKHTISRPTEWCSGNPCVDYLSSFCPSDTHICKFSRRTCKVSCEPKALPGSVSTNKLIGHEGLFPAATLFELLFPTDPNTSTKSSSTRNQQKLESQAVSKKLNQTHVTQTDRGGVGTRVEPTVG